MVDNKFTLHVRSWNACGVTTVAKLTALQAYVYRYYPQVIFIQEAFVGGPRINRNAPILTGCVSYTQQVRNGLVSYIHSSMQHKLLCVSDDEDTTYQLFEVIVGDGKIRMCNVYCVPGGLQTTLLPPPAAHGMMYLGDFNARHPELGDASPIGKRSGRNLLQYIR